LTPPHPSKIFSKSRPPKKKKKVEIFFYMKKVIIERLFQKKNFGGQNFGGRGTPRGVKVEYADRARCPLPYA